MNAFQGVSLTLVGILAALSVRALVRHRTTWRIGVAWTVLWVVAGIALAFPGLTAIAARLLGIGRGADLVFYSAILGAFVAFFAIYSRLRRTEAHITRLVRHIAIQEAARTTPHPQRARTSPEGASIASRQTP